jgi:hypothetical protein
MLFKRHGQMSPNSLARQAISRNNQGRRKGVEDVAYREAPELLGQRVGVLELLLEQLERLLAEADLDWRDGHGRRDGFRVERVEPRHGDRDRGRRPLAPGSAAAAAPAPGAAPGRGVPRGGGRAVALGRLDGRRGGGGGRGRGRGGSRRGRRCEGGWWGIKKTTGRSGQAAPAEPRRSRRQWLNWNFLCDEAAT